MTQALFSREDLARKPAHGQPCNRCGLCCRSSLCQLAMHVFHKNAWAPPLPGPCPALEHDDDEGSHCGLIADPQKYVKGLSQADAAVRSTAAKLILGEGLGCTARFNGEPRDNVFDRMLSFQNLFNTMKAALRTWGMLP